MALSCCNRTFDSAAALTQHTRDAPKHRVDTAPQQTVSKPLPPAKTQSQPIEGAADQRNRRITCSCGKKFKEENALEQHRLDSPRHGKRIDVQNRTIVLKKDKVQQPQPTANSSDDSTSRCDRESNELREGGSLRQLRHLPVPFVREGESAEKDTKKKMMKKKKTRSRGSIGNTASRSYRVWSPNTGDWYSDVGSNHGLCDKDCGWCGHCADGIL